MTPAERAVVEMAVRLVGAGHFPLTAEHRDLYDAVDVLRAERNGPEPETVEITWAQVVEGDKLYRGPDGRAAEPGSPGGRWMEVRQSGPIDGGKVRTFVVGLPRPIQPIATRKVIVQRGATGKAVDVLGSVLWSGDHTLKAQVE